ncbi:hypothetical protein P775_27995 [Puniceibacterium antarcticum]|uniref:Cytochrome c domain-containing protein n=1 Tax=Puniceibacterium antarcticum TaxID=1206336 RepID=A0A2G8QWZ7_9RHOB|nr:cytochrome c [Puniceibacterium antarcticum]PIL13809.1 hypothetical protein P775_27995 [Puniceibacterium antarcticum]
MVRISFALSAAAALMIAACAPSNTMPSPEDGRTLYLSYCAVCHGKDAKGDGLMARAMAKPPKDLTLISVRHGDKFPRARVMSTIDGYARSTKMAGPNMPEFGELLKGDLVPYDSGDGRMTPTPRRLVALAEYLETIQMTR